MDEKAIEYNLKGLELINRGRVAEAIDYFTMAIELEPDFADAYHNRGEANIILNRFVEGNTDIQRSKKIRAGGYASKKPEKTVKLDMQKVDSIYDTVFTDDTNEPENAHLEFDNSLYDYVFSDDAIEDEQTWDKIAQTEGQEGVFPAILEYLGGDRQEVAGAVLFTPTENVISIINQDGDTEKVIPLEQFGCIRTAGLPADMICEQDNSCLVEIVETIDGNIYHEFIHPDFDLEHVLIGFSTKEQTRFTFSVIPKSSIRKRRQQRFLGQILLEKRFIANDILKHTLDEHHRSKSMKLGKIIAMKAHVLQSAIEEELDKAKKQNITGLKTGEILLASGLVNEAQVLEALEYQEYIRNLKIGQFMVDKGIVQEKEIYLSLAEKHRMPFIDLRKQKVSKKILTYLPRELVLEYEIIPISLDKDTLVVATHYVEMNHLCEPILKISKCSQVKFVLTQPTHVKNIISLLYKKVGLGH